MIASITEKAIGQTLIVKGKYYHDEPLTSSIQNVIGAKNKYRKQPESIYHDSKILL